MLYALLGLVHIVNLDYKYRQSYLFTYPQFLKISDEQIGYEAGTMLRLT